MTRIYTEVVYARIKGVSFQGTVHKGNKIHVYRGIRGRDNVPFIARFLKAEYPTSGELERFENG